MVYSAMLTRGLANVREDMDAMTAPTLVGNHGYAAQELVNLMMFGNWC